MAKNFLYKDGENALVKNWGRDETPAPPTPQPSLLPWTPATPGEAAAPHPPPLREDATARLTPIVQRATLPQALPGDNQDRRVGPESAWAGERDTDVRP